MAKRRLPTGIQTFRKLRESNCYYVDKTGYALRLVEEGTHFFLSRPRRFGKSLFLDTLYELFAGRRELFEGLEAYDRWDWSVCHAVVRLDFAGLNATSADDLDQDVQAQLAEIEGDAGLEPLQAPAARRFRHLIRTLHQRTGQRVVVLVDEYDKPILDTMQEPSLALANRDYLRGLYGMIKACDAHVRFCFLTGVSKFSKVSLFSGLNNLIDITLEPSYSAICGYAEEDLDRVFKPELKGLDREHIREWYNGYSWGAEKVYNPYDLLLLFRKREFSAWWFQTGTPSFLIKTLIQRNIPVAHLDGMLVSEAELGTFDVDSIAPEALLFQTGYLTIGGQETRHSERCYRLVYPNLEVRLSLNSSLLAYLTGGDHQRQQHRDLLAEVLASGDLGGLEQRIRALYDSIPYQWQTRNEIARYEGYYASVLYGYLCGLDVEVTVEDSSNRGRLDLAVRAEEHLYLFELKVARAGSSGTAMAQLPQHDYAAKYRHLAVPIHLVGVEFSAVTRNVESFESALA